MDQPTSERILAYLLKNRTASVADLSRTLGQTRPNIQYHIANMLRAGKITPIVSDESPRRKGRPEKFYALAADQKPENLAALTSALLQILAQNRSPSAPDLPVELAQTMLPTPVVPPSLTLRLQNCVRHFNQHGYDARWEAHQSGPRLIFRACPYWRIIQDHPELCQMDQHIVRSLTGAPAQQRSRIHPADPTSLCLFTLESEAIGSTNPAPPAQPRIEADPNKGR